MANNSTFSYQDVLANFGEEKVAQRYTSIFTQMDGFIRRNKYEGKVIICPSILNQLVIDYFTDIYRLKEFHHIDLTNYIKITAYMSYWLVRRKPLQVIKDDIEDIDLAFCNENFVLSYIMRFLQGSVVNVHDENGVYHEFVSTLSYALRYRTLTPQMIELMLEGFMGGKVFQKTSLE
ncbi:MAG: hypothetical protein IJX01_04370 [Oscillospiraceae bacterium]|nr:hypothetical protein [Oscillospiraceae bacterium]